MSAGFLFLPKHLVSSQIQLNFGFILHILHIDSFRNDKEEWYKITIFKALSDNSRRDILEMLKEGKMTAGEIASKFTMSQATISHHLSVLRQADLVRIEKDGKFIFYELNTSGFEDLLKWIFLIREIKS